MHLHASFQRLLQATLVAAFGLLAVTAHANPEIPGDVPKGPVALVGGTVHPISGAAIEKGVVLFEKGKITAVGPEKTVALPKDTLRIDVAGKHVYPGLFDALTNLGLVEINSIRASVDDAETGSINPNVRAQAAVNPDSELIPTTRSNGILLALTAPTGGLLSGRSAVIQMDGWTWETMTLRADVGLHVQWPNMVPASESSGSAEGGDRALSELNRAFEQAAAYRQARRATGSNQPRDTRWESMLGVLDGEIPLIVHADEMQQIQAAVAFAARQKTKLIIYGGYDAPRCAALLKEHSVPVIVGGVYRLPMRRSDGYDAAYSVPARLHKAGIPFCISSGGRFGASNVRNLPYHAATAVAYGLPADEALKSITVTPAQILGVETRVGTLEPGKDATLFVADGDPLETPTHVEAAFVQGRPVELNDRHKRLWKKYTEKLRREQTP